MPTTNEADAAAADAAERAKLVSWVERNVGGHVVNMERERRWRPIWKISYEKDGREASVIAKGMRPFQCIPYSLRHEMLAQQILEKNGIPVPHVYGAVDENTFVMDFIEGEKDPGLVQQASEEASTISPERWQASLKFIEWLGKSHKIPVEEFAPTECSIPSTPDEIALALFDPYYQMVAERGAVDAVTEFFARWVRRNVPQHRTRSAIVFGDGGQFMNRGSEVAAIIDVEVAHVGDPYNDLAVFRCRHPIENMGDLPALFRHYAKVTGEEIDWKALAYSTVVYSAWGLGSYTMAMSENYLGGDWGEVVMAKALITRRTCEAIADCLGIDLPHDQKLPPPRPAPIEESGLEKLLMEINQLPTSRALAAWQRDALASIPRHLLKQAHYGLWAEQADLDEIEALIGVRPRDAREGDTLLKAFVETAGPESDEALLRLFHRQAFRRCLMIAGPGASEDHIMFARVEPILDGGKVPLPHVANG